MAKSRTMVDFKRNLFSAYPGRVDAGADVEAAPVGLMLDFDAVGLGLRLELSPFRHGWVFEYHPVGAAGDNRDDPKLLCPTHSCIRLCFWTRIHGYVFHD